MEDGWLLMRRPEELQHGLDLGWRGLLASSLGMVARRAGMVAMVPLWMALRTLCRQTLVDTHSDTRGYPARLQLQPDNNSCSFHSLLKQFAASSFPLPWLDDFMVSF